MRDLALFALGCVGGLAIGTWLNALGRSIVRLIFGWLAWFGILWAFSHLPTVWQILGVLVVVLVDLIRNTGEYGPTGERHHSVERLTLAGPVQPWQTGEPA